MFSWFKCLFQTVLHKWFSQITKFHQLLANNRSVFCLFLWFTLRLLFHLQSTNTQIQYRKTNKTSYRRDMENVDSKNTSDTSRDIILPTTINEEMKTNLAVAVEINPKRFKNQYKTEIMKAMIMYWSLLSKQYKKYPFAVHLRGRPNSTTTDK